MYLDVKISLNISIQKSPNIEPREYVNSKVKTIVTSWKYASFLCWFPVIKRGCPQQEKEAIAQHSTDPCRAVSSVHVCLPPLQDWSSRSSESPPSHVQSHWSFGARSLTAQEILWFSSLPFLPTAHLLHERAWTVPEERT